MNCLQRTTNTKYDLSAAALEALSGGGGWREYQLHLDTERERLNAICAKEPRLESTTIKTVPLKRAAKDAQWSGHVITVVDKASLSITNTTTT